MDPIGDMLTAIRNAQSAKRDLAKVSFSRIKFDIASRLLESGYLASVDKKGRKFKKNLELGLRYVDGKGAVSGLKRISKPGRRVYKSKDELPLIKQGYGMRILSTSKGVLTDAEARKASVGGEVLLEVW